MNPADREPRQRAKLGNERLKLMAGFCNTLGVAAFVTLVLAPLAGGRDPSALQIAIAMLAAFVPHGAGQAVLTWWRIED